MNDSPAKISVIQSRLPYTDRRSLSEAWFSALHLAAGEAGARGSSATVAPADLPATALRAARASAQREDAAGVACVAAARRRQSVRVESDAPRPVRVAPRAHLASPALARAASVSPFRAAFVVGVGGERVQLLVRRDGAALRVVALCRPHVAPTVRRALEAAGARLRALGIPARANVRAVAVLPAAVSA